MWGEPDDRLSDRQLYNAKSQHHTAHVPCFVSASCHSCSHCLVSASCRLTDLAASQQYEDSIGQSPSYADDDEYPISPVTEAKYNEMDEEDFMLCNLLPAGHACRKDELDGDGENKPPSENHAGDREPSPAQRPSITPKAELVGSRIHLQIARLFKR